MNKKRLLVWIPSFIGIILLDLSQIDLYLFKQGVLDVRTILGWELVLVLSGLLSAVVISIFGIVFLFKKNWLLAFQSFISPVLVMVCFTIGGVVGAAYLNAT